MASFGNTYLQDAAPWSLAKADPDDPRIAAVLYNCNQIAAALALFAHPFVPLVSAKIRTVLRQEIAANGDWAAARDRLEAGKPLLEPGHQIGEAGVLFPKIVDRKDDTLLKLIQAQRDKLTAALAQRDAGPSLPESDQKAATGRPPMKPEISFDDFTKLDLRTATILSAKAVPKSNKLLHLSIDLGGGEQRSVVSGIAKYFDPAELVGRAVTVVTNLAPRKMAGVLSEAMILMAEDAEGNLQFVAPPAGFGNGWTVR